MKTFGMWMGSGFAAGLLAVGMLMVPVSAMAQTGSIHGKVISAVGVPLTEGSVKLTTDKSGGNNPNRKYEYSFPLDATGSFKGTDIKPGTYVAVAFQGPVSVDFIYNLDIAAGEDKTADFDMTRAEYLAKMSPEERSKVEELKKQNAAAMASNAKVDNLNKLLNEARADNKAGNYAPAIKAMTDATTAKPDEPILWDTLGDAQLGDAVAADKAAKAAHATDASLAGKYAAAIASYEKAVSVNAAAGKPSPELAATAENQLGSAYGKSGKTKESAEAYEAAAKADPKNGGMYYFNEAATLFNAGDGDGAAAAADKAIVADPTKADAYYIKGQALIQKASVDPATNKVTVPPGCVEAYQKYLELMPTGAHAEEVKGILTGIGEPIKSTFKAAPTGRGR